ncbi:serine/arginine repetitive matrix protein 2-like isoform X2 [Littorina saxatilis]|uniref:serine/arginine repetitive matrix protein 2-like isoform X2 n=1 Tax=Littorina saxatilis TaxID=31220 RepID=UPI0038B5B535
MFCSVSSTQHKGGVERGVCVSWLPVLFLLVHHPHCLSRSVTEDWAWRAPPGPQLEEEGLGQLVDTVVRAAMAAALSKGHLSPGDPLSSYASAPASFSYPPSLAEHPPEPDPWAVEAGAADRMVRVKTNAVKVDVPMEGGGSSQEPEGMTVQLQPLQLFQGQPGDGVMKISFTIQSKVTRRRTQGPKGSWPIEDVTITQSQPRVTVVQPQDGQQASRKRVRVLQEQRNNVAPPPPKKEEAPASVVKSPSYQQNPAKRPHQSGRHGGKLGKPRKKSPRWARRGLTHPLSPVREEFLEGEDTLEALLARQNVDVDTDESLEDLLMMTDNYKENLAPTPLKGAPSQAASSPDTPASFPDTPAPIATAEDLDETGTFTPQGEKHLTSSADQPVFIAPTAVNKPLSQHPAQHKTTGEQMGTLTQEHLTETEPETKATKIRNMDEDIKSVDEEVSNTYSEASDGDIAPRKQEEAPAKAQEEGVASPVEAESDTSFTSATSAPEEETQSQDNEGGEHNKQSQEQKQDSRGLSESESKSERGFTLEAKEEQGDDPAEAPESIVEAPMVSTAAQKANSVPTSVAPLASQEVEDEDVCGRATSSPLEEGTRSALYRTDSASLESSPIINSPPFAGFPDPTHRELQRVRSVENELDEPGAVTRRSQKGRSAVRRVHSAGPVPHSKNRKTTIIDSTFRTVTIDPSKLTECGRPMSSFLLQSPGKGSTSSDNKWTLMDTVSKSVEELDVEDLDGVMIYGKSLEVLIHDTEETDDALPESDSNPSKSRSLEDLLAEAREGGGVTKGAKLYKEDMVFIARKPLQFSDIPPPAQKDPVEEEEAVDQNAMDFSAISPQKMKDLAEDEGPLVTSSPKLGRRRDGSFKKYQSKMGKSEETLLEVTPLKTERRQRQAARRSISLPMNYDVRKNRSKETLLDDHASLFTPNLGQEAKSSNNSMTTHDDTGRRGGMNRLHRSLGNDSHSVSRSSLDSQRQLGRRSREKVRSKETLIDDAPPPPSQSSMSTGRDESRPDNFSKEEEGSDPHRGSVQARSDRPKRRRQRAAVDSENDPTAPDTVNQAAADQDTADRRSSGRRRRRRQREMDREEAAVEADSQAETDRAPGTPDAHHWEDQVPQLVAAPPPPHTAPLDTEFLDTQDLPPPPPHLLQEDAVSVDLPEAEKHKVETHPQQTLQAQHFDDQDEQNQPPRVRRPKKKREKQVKAISDETPHASSAVEIVDHWQTEQPLEEKPVQEATVEERAFMSSFKQPLHAEQTVGEDFPSLSVKRSTMSADRDSLQEENTAKEAREESMMPVVAEDVVPIAGNLDTVDYGDEPPRARRSGGRPPGNRDENQGPTDTTGRAEARNRSREETESMGRGSKTDMTQAKGRDHRASRDSLVSGENRGSKTDVTQAKGRDHRASRDSLVSGENRGSKTDVTQAKGRDHRASRDSLVSGENRGSKTDVTQAKGRDHRASRDSLVSGENRGLRAVDLDMVSYDDEPPRVRRARRPVETDPRDNDGGALEVIDRPRSEGRMKGRREARGEGGAESERRMRRRRQEGDPALAPPPPQIRVHAASRESLDREDPAPPLPPKQHRSMERLAEYHTEPRRSRSWEVLDQPPQLADQPPELPPKKSKLKKLSCVGGPDMETSQTKPGAKAKKSKDRSSSKDRKKMPPPPAPPVPEGGEYREEPRRRRQREESNKLLHPMGNSFHRESSFDASFEKETHGVRSGKGQGRDGASAYYGDTEDELDDGEDAFTEAPVKPSPVGDTTVSPPQTPKPARKISTGSYGSVTPRPMRSVSFDDGYTPTMSNPPRRHRSKDSLASETSLHSMGYRVRSHSGASQTSVGSNPLMNDPWRAKAGTLHPPHSRSRRSRSIGEPTYSANAGRRRRSRTPNASDANRLYQPRRTRSRTSLPEAPGRGGAPSLPRQSPHDTSLLADDSFCDALSHGYASESAPSAPVRRTESERHPEKNRAREGDGDKPGSPTKSDPLDSASGGETLEERSSKEGSPTKEAPSPTKEKKKKKKFRMPSFSKKKKDSKESTI